jgi:hypothetical protein
MANNAQQNQKVIKFELDATELSPAQIRLIRSVNVLLRDVLVAHEEEDFFENSAEFMRICASIIQQSKFSEDQERCSSIPYAEQALEYSLDILQEHMAIKKVVAYDN